MTLADQLNKDLLTSLKEGDAVKRQVLSLVKSALTNFKIAEKKDKLSDEDVLKVLAKELKSRKESIKAFRSGGADARAAQEEAEAKILTEYLPEQMSIEDVETKIDEAIKKLGASDIKELGKVMGLLSSQLKGQTDMAEVMEMVKKKLSSS